ncbi:MAG: PaaI family thioesterase [Acidobacteria bacterium]|nr:MAG: PaaI family thioesterase [Acidobacteriota bacterium]REK11357.1 MAG: PaaI family thioesterase [Acidobacteriota bacterium]
MLASMPYVAFLGMGAVRRGDELTFTLPFRAELVGNTRLPALHGGAIGAFLETAAHLQLAARVASEKLPKTIDFSIEYLRSGRPRDTYARAEIVKLGRRVCSVQAVAWQDERQRPIATARGAFLLTPLPGRTDGTAAGGAEE